MSKPWPDTPIAFAINVSGIPRRASRRIVLTACGVNFFGLPACTTAGPARLGARTGVPLVPAFLVRQGESDQHRLIVFPDIELAQTGNREADIVTNTQRCSDVVERVLREYPDQWIWFHRRWRTRPEGEPEFY